MTNKKKDRAERIRIKKHLDSINSLYPKVTYINEHIADKELLQAVKNAIDMPDFQKWLLNRSLKYQIYIDFLKHMKKHSREFNLLLYEFDETFACDKNIFNLKNERFVHARAMIKVYRLHSNEKVYLFNLFKHLINLTYLFGIYIHEKIDDKIKTRLLPHHYFRVVLLPIEMGIVFYKLDKVYTPNGNVHMPHYKKIVKHEGKDYQLAYTNHALDRFVQRHLDESVINSFIKQDSFYEFITASKHIINIENKDNPLIETYLPISNMYVSDDMCKWINEFFYEFPSLDSGNVFRFESAYSYSETDYPEDIYVKMFYSPVKFDGEKAILLTNLLPGFKNTPEYDFWKNGRVLKKEDYLMMKDFYSNLDVKTNNCTFEKIQTIFYENNFIQFKRGWQFENCRWPRSLHEIEDRI